MKRHTRSSQDPLFSPLSQKKTKKKNSKSKNICSYCGDPASYIKRVQDQLDEVKLLIDTLPGSLSINSNTSVMTNSNNFDDNIREIKDGIEKLNEYLNESFTPCTTKPTITPPEISVSEHFMNPVEVSSLIQELEGSDIHWENLGNREVLYCGEFDYSYSNVVHKARPLPRFIQDVIVNKIAPKYVDHQINSVIISKYENGRCSIGAHSDNEAEISPWSDIFNISLGESRTMRLKSLIDPDTTTDHVLMSGTLNVMSREMQETWTHEIIKEDKSVGIRYSLTFRNIQPLFNNATIIVGDSNTIPVVFGDVKGTLGSKCPGKREKCFLMEQLPAASKLSPYKNIIIHCGVNNLKNPLVDPSDLVLDLERRCVEIHELNPNCRIAISSLIPTKDKGLNKRVDTMNRMLCMLSLKDSRLMFIDHSFMADFRTGLLKPLFQRETSDDIHLSDVGIKHLAAGFKRFIRNRRRA